MSEKSSHVISNGLSSLIDRLISPCQPVDGHGCVLAQGHQVFVAPPRQADVVAVLAVERTKHHCRYMVCQADCLAVNTPDL